MLTLCLGGADVALTGTFLDSQLDPGAKAKYGRPAIVPNPFFSGVGVFPPSDGHFSVTGTWAAGVTSTPNSSISFSYVGYGAELTFATGPHGGIGFVTLDGAPRLAVDTYSPTNSAISYVITSPSPGAHVLTITYYGDLNNSGVAFSAPVNGVGTSVTPNVTLVRLYRGATTAGSHTITALTSSTVSVDGAGSYANGTTVTVVPGLNIVLGTGAMTVGDTSTFTTYPVGLTVTSGQVAVSEVTDAGYTTGVIDPMGQVFPIIASFSGGAPGPLFFTLESSASLETDTVGVPVPVPIIGADPSSGPVQWVLATWEEDPAFPVQSGYAIVGNTRNPSDGSWWITPAATNPNGAQLSITHDALSTGEAHGYMGLLVLPRSAYAMLHVDIPFGGYIQNLRLLHWNPDTDGERDRFPPLPNNDLANRIIAAQIAAATIDLRDPLQEAISSLSFGTAVGQGLDRRMAEWGLVRPYGMDDSRGARLLRLLSVSAKGGATVSFINKALSLMLGPNVPFAVRALPTTTAQWVLDSSLLGVDTYLSPVTVGQLQATLQVKVSALTIPPQTVQAIVNLFLTAGVNLTFIWN